MLKTNLQHEEKEKEKGGRREDMREREGRRGEGGCSKQIFQHEGGRERERERESEMNSGDKTSRS